MEGLTKLTQASNGDPIWVRLSEVQSIRKHAGGSILSIGGTEITVDEGPKVIMGGQPNAETEPGRKRVVIRGQMHTRRPERRNGEARQAGGGDLPFNVANNGRT